MNSAPDHPTPSHIGPLKGFLIHLAGSDPSAFVGLPPAEATSYAKMGATVLVPCSIALSAGTFTIYTLMEDKSLFLSIIFGIAWATIILIIDMAIMSQLIKRRRIIIPAQPAGPPVFGKAPEAAKPPVVIEEKGGCRNIIVGLMRSMIAVALGYVMSHCLVLAAFSTSVSEQMNETHSAIIKRKEAAHQETITPRIARQSKAQGVSAIADDDSFLKAYKAYNQEIGSLHAASSETKATPTTSAALQSDEMDPELRRLKASALEKATEYATTKATLEGALQAKQGNLAKYQGDLKSAELMLQYESDGKKSNRFSFVTPEFTVLGSETSGLTTRGTRAIEIEKKVEEWKPKVAAMEKEVKDNQAELEAYIAQNQDEQKEIKKSIQDRDALLSKTANSSFAVQVTNTQSEALKLRVLLTDDIKTQTTQINALIDQHAKDIAHYTTKSRDIIGQSRALHALMFSADENGDHSRQAVVLTLVVALMLCLMFLDLTPLMMKLLQSPSAVDEVREQPFVSNQHQAPAPGGGAPPPGYPTGNQPRQRPEPPINRPRP